MSARNLGEARATLGEARILLVRLEKSAPYLGEGCLPPLSHIGTKFFRCRDKVTGRMGQKIKSTSQPNYFKSSLVRV